MLSDPITPALARLHALGWSVGSAALAGPAGAAWVVTGRRTRGEDLIRAECGSEAEGWWKAVEQAEGLERHPKTSSPSQGIRSSERALNRYMTRRVASLATHDERAERVEKMLLTTTPTPIDYAEAE